MNSSTRELKPSSSSSSHSNHIIPSTSASEPFQQLRDKHGVSTVEEIQACYSCGKLATTEPCQNACSVTVSSISYSESVIQNGFETDVHQTERKFQSITISATSGQIQVGKGGGTDLESKNKAKAGSQLQAARDPSIYFDASDQLPNAGLRLSKSAQLEDVANLDVKSQIPERGCDDVSEIFDPSSIPKQPKRHHHHHGGRKKWCCCCCQKKKNSRELNGNAGGSGGQMDGTMNNNHDTNQDEEVVSAESSLNIFPSCLGSQDEPSVANMPAKYHTGMKRRSRIPDRPNYSLNLWSILKNAVGKELTKVAMPVNFSEPLSMLQRLTEDYEYSSILDSARKCTDSCEQMCYVAAFTISSYATTAIRTGKPFNPLLGETFECDRTGDLGWRCISEQVSHHPPTAALYCEGFGWKCWQEFTMSSKFRGNYLEIVPLGIAHLTFEDGNHYTWRKVTTVVHNLVVGKLWVEQSGEMVLTNHTTGETCQLKYIPYSMFNKKQKEVVGSVIDKNGYVKWHISGTWDDRVEAFKRRIPKKVESKSSQKSIANEVSNGTTLWARRYPPSESEKYYNFTEFACQLNEMEDGVAPTDSRLRPDQRLMEEGDFDAANQEKVRLEEKQRAARRKYGNDENYYRPFWFQKEKDSVEGSQIHVYKGEYWSSKQSSDWKRCPDIF